MMGLEDSLKQLAEVWKSWSFGKKAFITVGALVSIIGFGMIISSPNEQNFSPVMTNLSIQDANSVTQALEQAERSDIIPVLPWTERREDGQYLCIPVEAGYAVSEEKMPERNA